MTESHIQHDILLRWGSHPRLRLWRANTGLATMGERKVRFGVKGQADISGIILLEGVRHELLGTVRGGRLGLRLEIECKSLDGKQSPEQKLWEKMITGFGGAYCLARSVADVDAFMLALGVTR